MDNTSPIVPTFDGQLEHSAAALCDFFLIAADDLVPVTKVTMWVDGEKHNFPVRPGKYKMALFLLYCAVLRRMTSFPFDAELQAMLVPYFGNETVESSRLPGTSHSTLQLLVLGSNVQVNLALKPSFDLPMNPSRTIKKLIEHAWHRHKAGTLNKDSSAPLIRQAIRAFRQAERDGTIRIIDSRDPKIWPSDTWVDRVHFLVRDLSMPKSQ